MPATAARGVYATKKTTFADKVMDDSYTREVVGGTVVKGILTAWLAKNFGLDVVFSSDLHFRAGRERERE